MNTEQRAFDIIEEVIREFPHAQLVELKGLNCIEVGSMVTLSLDLREMKDGGEVLYDVSVKEFGPESMEALAENLIIAKNLLSEIEAGLSRKLKQAEPGKIHEPITEVPEGYFWVVDIAVFAGPVKVKEFVGNFDPDGPPQQQSVRVLKGNPDGMHYLRLSESLADELIKEATT